jgi:hypothetical protein
LLGRVELLGEEGEGLPGVVDKFAVARHPWRKWRRL